MRIKRTELRGEQSGSEAERRGQLGGGAAAHPEQSCPSHCDQAMGTECLPGALDTSEGRVTCQIVTRQHRELVRCLGTR